MVRLVDRGVDGFRMDVINIISKRVGPDGALSDRRGTASSGRASVAMRTSNGPRVHEFLEETNAAAQNNRRRGRARLITGRRDAGHPGPKGCPGSTPTCSAPRSTCVHLRRAHGARQPAWGLQANLAPLSLPALKAILSTGKDGGEAGLEQPVLEQR